MNAERMLASIKRHGKSALGRSQLVAHLKKRKLTQQGAIKAMCYSCMCYFVDGVRVPNLSLTCTIAETGTREAYTRDTRGIAQRAEKYLAGTGLADQAFFGPEAEFFIFDNVQYDHKCNGTFYTVDSEEAVWNTGRDEMPNLAYKIRHKEGYFPVAPSDTQQDIRTEMSVLLEALGVKVERQHHEVATAGQAEIDYRFETLVRAADFMMVYKYVIKNVARRHGKRIGWERYFERTGLEFGHEHIDDYRLAMTTWGTTTQFKF